MKIFKVGWYQIKGVQVEPDKKETKMTMTLREQARDFVTDQAGKYAELDHARNYHRLHVRRDGSVAWTEFHDSSSDLIDGQANHFCAIHSVARVGTGSYVCNCDYCGSVVYPQNRQDETTDRQLAEAVQMAVDDSDLDSIAAAMLEKFDGIEAGYFDDEPDEPEETA